MHVYVSVTHNGKICVESCFLVEDISMWIGHDMIMGFVFSLDFSFVVFFFFFTAHKYLLNFWFTKLRVPRNGRLYKR